MTDPTYKVANAYHDLVRRDILVQDAAQAEAVKKLDTLCQKLAQKPKNPNGWFANWFGRSRIEKIKGLYLWGGVGCGKTMLMDLFFDLVPMQKKRRVHFHEFMADVHGRIDVIRKDMRLTDQSTHNLIVPVAQKIAKESELLCFDEFRVVDIADAMIISRLFAKLFDLGVTVVATSNLVPERLYHNGLNRNLFLPFIDVLHMHMDVFELASFTDYRLAKFQDGAVFVFGSSEQTTPAIDEMWQQAAGPHQPQYAQIAHLGRTIEVPRQVGGAARFDFQDICGLALAAPDYLLLSERFHTLYIDHVPQFSAATSNQAKRFILLIDAMYDNQVKLVASFAVPLDELVGGSSVRFEFERTVSRLTQMQSEAYLGLAHRLRECA